MAAPVHALRIYCIEALLHAVGCSLRVPAAHRASKQQSRARAPPGRGAGVTRPLAQQCSGGGADQGTDRNICYGVVVGDLRIIGQHGLHLLLAGG